MRLGGHSLSGLETWFPKETVSISTKLTPRTPRKLAPLVVRNRKRNSLLRYELSVVDFVDTL